MKRIGWFTTGRGPGSQNLFMTMVDRIKSGQIDVDLAFVFINRDVKGNLYRKSIIETAESMDVPVIILPSERFMPELKESNPTEWRDAYGQALRASISKYPMDFGVLAGYMLVVDPETCRQFTIINLHPALPGTYKGTWEEIVQKVVENGDDRYGATVHVCTPELDCGEPIAYDSFPVADIRKRHVSSNELVKVIRAEELKREAYLLMVTIKAIVDGEVTIKDGRLFNGNGKPLTEHPNLADRIDAALRN
ncbi:MAG: formyltransferase family protein [Methanomassiliicoccales archaeon]|jgi:phosphoribosylglycinamide formyltransferase-1